MIDVERKGIREVTIRHRQFIVVTPKEELSWDDTFQLLTDLQMFYTLMVGEPGLPRVSHRQAGGVTV